jgi:hypothetical protein
VLRVVVYIHPQDCHPLLSKRRRKPVLAPGGDGEVDPAELVVHLEGEVAAVAGGQEANEGRRQQEERGGKGGGEGRWGP